jgi:electron transfer flavoprotein alpha subunit
MFLRPRTAGSLQAFAFRRAYSTAPSPHALVFLEHRQGVIDSASLSALTAAEQLGGQVTGLVVGGPDHVPGVVEKAKK